MHRTDMSERQTQIVEVALRILASEGPRRFTAQRLATEIGVTPGAIYRHFKSMEAIVDVVVDRMEATLFEGFPPEAEDPIECLRLFFHRRARVILANPHVSRLLLTDYLAQVASPTHAARVQKFKQRSQRFAINCLRRAARDGVLSNEVSPEAGAVILLGAVLALSHAGTGIAKGLKTADLFDDTWAALDRLFRDRHERREGHRPAATVQERTRVGAVKERKQE
jgi:AcrR family transcriptional regulator